ncbi:MAG: zinc ribbon domain-containing protein [Nitrospinota bacterium]
MPIYEYRCKDCGDETEAIQGVSAKPLKRCAKCGGKLAKLISQNAFHLKGAGWYKTDYAPKDNKGDKKVSEKKGEDKTKKETASSPTAETKKEASSEKKEGGTKKEKAENKSAA